MRIIIKTNIIFKSILLICVVLVSHCVFAQGGIQVSGTVNNGEGEPLEGATVQVKNRSNVVTTNNNGEFSINAARNAILLISHATYKPVEVAVSGRERIGIVMDSAISSMDEVIVVGYGTMKKSDVTGSISRVDLDKELDNRFLSVTEAMQGKLAGVTIINNTGEPGGGMTFNIRGKTSITGENGPLIVIDGQPIESSYSSTKAGMQVDGGVDISAANPLAALNPNDIASIEVLKDASSTAIYGSRGANGVVLITTKSGKSDKNGRDRFTYTNRFDLSQLPKKIPVLSSLDFMYFRNEAAMNDGKAPVYSIEEIDSVRRNNINIDWQDQIYIKALSQDHQLSFSGRDNKSNYVVTGNYSDQRSIIRNAKFVRYGLRANYERQVTERLKLGVKNYFSWADRHYGQQANWTGIMGSSAVMGALVTNPMRIAYTEDGELDETFANNPVLVTSLVKDLTQIRTLISNLNIEYRIAKGFNYTFRGGVNDMYAIRNVYYPIGTFIGNTAPNGSATRADNGNTNYLADHLLTYKTTLNKLHSINAVGGFSFQRWISKSTSVTNMNFPSDALTYYNFNSASSPGRMITVGPRARVLKSWLGRFNYAFDKRYILTLTGRYDGASRLAPGNKWQFFPSVGLGWNVMNEDFFTTAKDVVSTLKFRASYGIAGNENIPIGATLAKYAIDYDVVGSTIVPGYVLDDFDNPSLGWEITKQANAGMDIGFLDERLSFSIDVYKKRTSGLLMNLSLPGSSGFLNYFTNVGEIENSGMDIEATWNVIKSPVNWNMSANFSTVKNKILNMGELDIAYGRVYAVAGGTLLSQALQVAKVGYPISSFWGYKTDGIYQTQAEIDAGPEKGIAKPGMIKWVDTNGDGKISDDDKTVLGDPVANYTFGWNNDFTYKNFTFSFSVLGSKGNQLINLNQWFIGANNTNGNLNASYDAYYNRWRGPGTSNKYPMLTTDVIRLQQRLPDWMVEDASFVRLQSARLGYSYIFKQKKIINSLRVYVSGTNLLTLTKYSAYDPNVNAFDSDAIGAGMDFGTLPLPRTFSAGLEVGF